MLLELPHKSSTVTFHNIPTAGTNSQKQLGMLLDNKINFDNHISKVLSRVNKTVAVIFECYTL